jgi:hypothetical protein
MALRRGRQSKPTAATSKDGDDETLDEVVEESATEAEIALADRPLDETEASDGDVLPRLDLGGLRVPVLAGTEVRIEMNEMQQPIATTIVHGPNSLQVLAFAAPRNGGIWDEVRAEIADSVRTDGGEPTERTARFGVELHAVVRPEVQPGQVVEQALRFVGFDGPRWFLRGVFTGPAATDPDQATVLEAVLTSIVVIRGTEPMAPRDPLPVRLPRPDAGPGGVDGAAGSDDGPEDGEEPARPRLQLPVRGPEITETR